jgi:glycogen debranching enzyme
MNNRQPFLHDLNVLLAAPMQVWSGHDGQLRRSGGVQGIYCADTRVIDEAVLTVNGQEPEPVGSSQVQGSVVSFQALIRTLGSENPDPLVSLTRRRKAFTDRVTEEIILRSDLAQDVTALIQMDLSSDFSPLESVKAGGRAHPVQPEVHGGVWRAAEQGVSSLISAPGAEVEQKHAHLRLRWELVIPARGSARVGWEVQAKDSLAPFIAGARTAPAPFRVSADDRRLTALAERAVGDLEGLRMSALASPQDVFLAAGAPWFFTLFGRDSLIAARMLLPVDPSLAAGTLRTLAARQGTKSDPATAEQPGKILHEVRRGALWMPSDASNGELRLPPVYYGTVDATLLWISLLHDAWKWGMPEEEVTDLMSNLERALVWLRDWADPDGDGFLEYIDETGYGLANQGWKDSADSIRWNDGSLATGPIALAEVQGYAYQAAVNAADLLEAFGLNDAGEWRAYAADLAGKFRTAFWCRDELAAYPAIALDVDKRPVDGVASNMGHLLGTGILNEEESELVARRIMDPTMFSGYGVRTLDTGNGAYWPLRYHSGSVWAHDTAMTLEGLTRAGYSDEAALLAAGLVEAAEIFDYRLPELFSGHSSAQGGPQPYPASCRPQAWAAASAIPVMLATLGLAPQGPGQLPEVAATVPVPFGACTFEGLQAGGRAFTVDVDRHGATTVTPA